jgi:transposase, IS6 family
VLRINYGFRYTDTNQALLQEFPLSYNPPSSSASTLRESYPLKKVGKTCKHLYRAVDTEGQTIEVMLGAKRDVSAAKRFFTKMMRAEHRRLPFSISVDKNAAYPEAFSTSQEERVVPKDCKLRRVKYESSKITASFRRRCEHHRASRVFTRRSERSKALRR